MSIYEMTASKWKTEENGRFWMLAEETVGLIWKLT
jgi:hypothetical protein